MEPNLQYHFLYYTSHGHCFNEPLSRYNRTTY